MTPKIGFMMTAVGADGDDDQSWYRQLIGDAELGASLGFDAGWIVEHHFSNYQPTPNTLLMLAHIAARCPTLGLGTAVIVTPWHQPLRLAEEIAMLSLLTKAPLRIGLGRGNAPLARRYVPGWYQLQLERYAFDAVKYASVRGYQPFTDGMKCRQTWSNPDNLDSLIDVSFIGSPESVRAKVQKYLDLGYDYLLLNASTPGMPEHMRHDWLTRFARDVLPYLGRQATPESAKVAMA